MIIAVNQDTNPKCVEHLVSAAATLSGLLYRASPVAQMIVIGRLLLSRVVHCTSSQVVPTCSVDCAVSNKRLCEAGYP
jgi:hypothetical protein